MKKVQLISLLLIGLLTFGNYKEVNASSVSSSLSLSKTTVKANETFTVSLNVSGLTNGMISADYNVSYDTSKFTYVSYSMGQGKPPSDIILNNTEGKILISYVDSQNGGNPISNGTLVNLTFKSNSTVTNGTSTFSLSGGGYADKDANSISGTCSGVTVNTYVPSTDNNLSSLSISNGTLSPSFNKDTLNYSATVDVSSITISATGPSKGTVTGTGNKGLNYGTNTFNVVVTSESGSTKTYTITVTRPDNRSTNNYLKTLTLSDIDTKFNKNTLTYNYTVENDVEEVVISASAEDKKSSVTGTGKKSLSVGINTFKIVVTAENGTTKTYTVIISRKDEDGNVEELSSNTGLSIIKINNKELELKNNVYKYTYSVENDVTKVDIDYQLADETSTATIIGDTNLKEGKNTIKIKVTAQDGTSKTYELIINKKSNSEENDDKNIINKKSSDNSKKIEDIIKNISLILAPLSIIINVVLVVKIMKIRNPKNNDTNN